MIHLTDVLDVLFASEGGDVEILLVTCSRCKCYHIAENEERLCEVCLGPECDYVKEKLGTALRIREDGTYEPEDS